MNAISLAIEKAGTQKALAKAVGVSTMAVSKWLASGKVPAERVLVVEKLTGIPCYQLRPDLYPSERFKKAS